MSEVKGGGSGGVPTPYAQIFSEMEQLATSNTEAKEGIKTLQQVNDKMMSKGYVSLEDIQTIKNQAAIINPSLSPPNQALLSQFLSQLSVTPSTGGTESNMPIGSGKNAFLNCSAILMLFILISKIITIESKIQLQENLYKAKLGLAMVATAKEAYNAALAQGKLEATQYLARATKAAADAGVSLAQIGLSVVMHMATTFEKQRQETKQLDLKKQDLTDKGMDIPHNLRLDATERYHAHTDADTKIKIWQGSVDGATQAMKSMIEVTLDKKEADLATAIAQQKGTSELLGQMMNLLSQSASMLSNAADNDMAKSIQSQLELFQSAVRTFGEIGSR